MNFDDFIQEIGENTIEAEAIRQMARMVSDIVKRRKVLGLTQEEVARRAGLTQAQVARLENSSQLPRGDTLIKVAIALGMNMILIETEEQAVAGNQLVHA